MNMDKSQIQEKTKKLLEKANKPKEFTPLDSKHLTGFTKGLQVNKNKILMVL